MNSLDLSRRVLDELLRGGLAFAVHSPGARNLPLLAALREHEELPSQACLDERAAGYLALGWMRGRALAGAGWSPALALCTSGGAALNLLPAAAEAGESGLPLILLTADRPAEEIGRGANQTVDQLGPFAPLVRAQLRVSAEEEGWETALRAALARLRHEPGALQVNVALREPLLPADREPLRREPRVAPTDEPPGWLPGVEDWSAGPGRARRGLVWVCDLPRLEDRRAARALAARLGWPLLGDGGAGLWQAPAGQLPPLRHGEDLLAELSDCDFVLQLGKRPISRLLLEVLHRCPGVVVDAHLGRQDPLGLRRPRWSCAPARLLTAVEEGSWQVPTPAADWLHTLSRADRAAAARRSLVLEEGDRRGEVAALRCLLTHLPQGWGLFAGNSLPIRMLDQWSCGLDHDVLVLGNRGLSGIDGQLACALGAQRGLGRPLAVLLGDLSLLHDLSSLALWAQLGAPLLVLVLHNQGGGIFRLHRDSRDQPWSWGSHDLPLAEPARALGLEARRPADLAELAAELAAWRESPRPLLLEWRVPPGEHAQRCAALTRHLPESTLRQEPVRRVWLHGFLGDPADWDVVRGLLPPAPGGDLAPRLPGHGASPSPVPPELDEWLEHLLLELGGEDPLELVGYSLGGRLALRLALRDPGRVRRLVLLGASPGLPDSAERARRRALDEQRASRLETQGLEAFLLDWYRQPLFAAWLERPGAAAWLERRRGGVAPSLARVIRVASPGRQPDLWPDLSRLAMPVLWLAGEQDTVYAELAARGAGRCPLGQLALVAGAGHAAHLEEPAALAGRLAEFFSQTITA